MIPQILKQQKHHKDNSDSSKNVEKPTGIIGNENNVSENQHATPLNIKVTSNLQKRDNDDTQLSTQCKKLKLENFPSMPLFEKEKDEETAIISSIITPPSKKVSLVPYELDEEEEERNEAKLLRTASGVFYETEIKKNIKGPSMHGSTIITKASSENQQIKRNEDTVQQLSKLHHNGYGSGNVMSWSNQATQMSKEVCNEQQTFYGKRQLDLDDDVDMDRGRLKKIKIHSQSPTRSGGGKLPNPFQEQQNLKNGYHDRSSSQHYHNNSNHHHRFNNNHNNNNNNNHNGSHNRNKPYPNWKQNGSRVPYRNNNRSNHFNRR